MRILPITAALLAAQTGAALAGTASFEATQQPGSSFLELQQFNPNIGQLTQLTLVLTGTVAGNFAAEATRTRGGPSVFTFTLKSAFSLGLPGHVADAPLTVTPSWVETRTVGLFDGVLDFGGTSGTTLADRQASGSQAQSYTDPVLLGLFTGSGQVSLPVLSQDLSSISGVANYRGGFDTSRIASAKVTYTYNLPDVLPPPTTLLPPLQPVPEPTTWALMLAGLGGLGWLAKRGAA
jgi:hypothetical protein